MKLSQNWLKDYVGLTDLSPDEFISKIILSICEVDNFIITGEELKKIVVAEVLEIKKHPNADKLSLVLINNGKETYEIVCGATNFKIGDKVPYAPIGVNLADFTVKKAKIRGVESNGVLCAEDEIGFGEDHSGLMILDKSIAIGASLATVYPDQLDLILDIDNKSINHRPDLWGHYGFAKELATLFGVDFKEYNFDKNFFKGNSAGDFTVTVECPELVPRFSAINLTGLQTNLSPDWLRFRLHRIGLRAINNLVDVTNYVMLDLGQPMHIFDKKKLPQSKLIVRKAKEKEKLITLYEKEIELNHNDLVITDGEKVTSLAGVVGGLDSGVQTNTENAVLEAACWNASSIRKTSNKTKHRTDASLRFEKSLDPTLTTLALAKALEILRLTNPNLKIKGNLIDIFTPQESILIDFNPQDCQRLLGITIPLEKIDKILICLGFSIKKKENYWQVTVPSWRATRDISIAEDLVEEVGRHYGYDKIKAQIPNLPLTKPVINQQRKLERKAKQILINRGYFEIFTYPLSNKVREDNWQVNTAQQDRLLINPMSESEIKMRQSLLPQFSEIVALNVRDYNQFKIFEIGRIYNWFENKPQEKEVVFGVNYNDELSLKELFQQAKEDCAIFLKKLLNKQANFEKLGDCQGVDYLHPYAKLAVFIDKFNIGRIFSITPQKRHKLNYKGNIVFLELDFDLILSLNKQKETVLFKEITKYPKAKFEISLLVPKNTYFSDLTAVIANQKIIEKIEFKYDYFPPDKPDKKSVTLALSFRSKEQTIESEYLSNLQDKLVNLFEKQGFLLRR